MCAVRESFGVPIVIQAAERLLTRPAHLDPPAAEGDWDLTLSEAGGD